MRTVIAFIRGMIEFRLTYTWADPRRSEEEQYTGLDDAYDRGRELAHRITRRRYEP